MPAASKRPAANVADATQPRKKPAAMPSVNETLRKLKGATASPEEEDHDSEAGTMVLAKRDKGKGEKFARMRAAGQIPQHILHLYDETAKSSPSPRDFRTNVINQLFNKSDSGVFSMNTGAKLFTEAYTKSTNRSTPGTNKRRCPARSFLASFFKTTSRPVRESEREKKEVEKRKTIE